MLMQIIPDPRNYRPSRKIACLLFGLVFLSSCAVGIGDKITERLVATAQNKLEELDVLPEGRCAISAFVGPTGIIHAVGKSVEAVGLQPGDRILAVDQREISTRMEIIRAVSGHSSTDRISFTVARGAGKKEITVTCVDVLPFLSAQKRVWDAAASEDWDSCVRAIDDYLLLHTVRYGPVLLIGLACHDAKRRSDRRGFTSIDAGITYEAYQKSIEHEKYDQIWLTNIREDFLRAVEVLRINGFISLAQDLQSQFDQATSQTVQQVPSPDAARPKHGEARKETQVSSATGFFVSEGGHILTNYHVVDDCATITIRQVAGVQQSATLVAQDRKNDLAVILVKERFLSVPAFRSGKGARIGDRVITYGFPLVGALATSGNLTEGILSALVGLGDDSRYFQITVPVQQGNSGGALLDSSGNVVGIVSSKLNALMVAEITGDIPQNVNFAIKASLAREFLEANGIDYKLRPSSESLTTADIGDLARKFTVRVLCE